MDRITAKTLQQKVNSIYSIPTLPASLKQISKIMEKPAVSLDEISRCIANDPALTTKVLKMVNSAVYGFPGRISSVSHATVLLGLNVIKGLLIGISVIEIMQEAMAGLWEHSLGCAVGARRIATKKGIKDPEEIYVAGLLHDIGKVILCVEYQELYGEIQKQAEEKVVSIFEMEKEYFEKTHSDVGAWLTEKWCFPVRLTESIKYHHNPTLSRKASLETAIVHFSDVLVRARGIGFSGNDCVPVLEPKTFDCLNLSERDIEEILEEIDNYLEETGSF